MMTAESMLSKRTATITSTHDWMLETLDICTTRIFEQQVVNYLDDGSAGKRYLGCQLISRTSKKS